MASAAIARETAAAIAQTIYDLATKTGDFADPELDEVSRLAEIADYSEALGDYITGTPGFRMGPWYKRWGGISFHS